jgi:pyruvate dehydrogenase E2 component (dihydrolipoamide acetyltransferase)
MGAPIPKTREAHAPMPIELKMPALSPTMEVGTLAKWLVKEGDAVKSGDILAEIETDKATMEFEAVDEGTIAQILIAEGTEGVQVGAPIALLAEEGEDAAAAKKAAPEAKVEPANQPEPTAATPAPAKPEAKPAAAPAKADDGDRIKASPLAKRIAQQQGVDLATIVGSGPGGRVVKADIGGSSASQAAPTAAAPTKAAEPVAEAPASADGPKRIRADSRPVASAPASAGAAAPGDVPIPDIPNQITKLSSMRKVIARRLTESKQQVPHIYLTVDVRLDALLKLRGELNKGLEGRNVKLSVNDMLIKALAVALIEVPACNVMLAGDKLVTFSRADISVAVSIPGGLITPIITGADTKSLSAISTAMQDLGARAKEGKLKPEEYQGGTASLSNMGMLGIKQFDAVINPPQGMILAIGAGEKRPYVVDDQLAIATVMSATGSFDHRAIDGADGARLMAAFKRLVEAPLGMLA